MPTLTYKEFYKIIKIFGAKVLLDAYIDSQVTLTPSQVQKAIDIKNGKRKK